MADREDDNSCIDPEREEEKDRRIESREDEESARGKKKPERKPA